MRTELNVNPIDKSNLYQINEVTDYRNGKIIVSVPIFEDGEPDPMRAVLYEGATQVNMPGGQRVGIKFKLEVNSLPEALAAFGPACAKAMTDLQSKVTQSQIATAGGALSPNGAGVGPQLDLSKLSKKH